ISEASAGPLSFTDLCTDCNAAVQASRPAGGCGRQARLPAYRPKGQFRPILTNEALLQRGLVMVRQRWHNLNNQNRLIPSGCANGGSGRADAFKRTVGRIGMM